MAQKFKPGDRVRVVGYGHPIWMFKAGWPAQAAIEADYDSMILYGKSGLIPVKEKPDNIIAENSNSWTIDMTPSIVGKEGTIKGSYADMIESGDPRFRGPKRDESTEHTYIIDGIPEKSAWYDEQQLELID